MNGQWLKRGLAAGLLALAGGGAVTARGDEGRFEWMTHTAMESYIDVAHGWCELNGGGSGTADYVRDGDFVVFHEDGSAPYNILIIKNEGKDAPGGPVASLSQIRAYAGDGTAWGELRVDGVSGLTVTRIGYDGRERRPVDSCRFNASIVTVGDKMLVNTLHISNSRLDVSAVTAFEVNNEIRITLGANNLDAGGDFALKINNTNLNGALNRFAADGISVTGSLGEKYRLVQVTDAAAVAATAAALESKIDTSVLYAYKVTIDGSGYYVVKSAAAGGAEALRRAAVSDSSANAGIGAALAQIAMDSANPSLRALVERLDALMVQNPAAAGRAVTELNGANAAVGNVRVSQNAAAQFNNALGNVFADRLSAAVSGVRASAGGAPGREESASAGGVPVTYADFGKTAAACDLYTGWFKVYGGFGGVDGTRTAAGYDFGGVGVMTGIERTLGNELSLGALFGWSFNRSQIAKDMGDATDNILRFGVYGNYQWNGFQFSTTPSVAIHMLENERNIHFLHATARSERTGMDVNWFNKVAYAHEFGNGLILTPSYALGATYLHDPAHREHGADAADLRIRDCDNWSLTQNLELKAGRVFQLNGRVAVLPEIWGGWEHEYLSSNDVSMSFAAAAGNSWTAPVEDIAADRAVFGAGVKTLIGERWQIEARYDQKIWDGGYNTNFSLGASLKF